MKECQYVENVEKKWKQKRFPENITWSIVEEKNQVTRFAQSAIKSARHF